ncbi:MAG: hypothetical protein QM730_00080 [Anaerolineales bacterium]
MPLSSSHHDLFQQSGTADKISLFQNLLHSHDLNADEALALLRSIHADLEQPQGHERSVYESYAHMMESLRHEMPDVHQHVVENWKHPRQANSTEKAEEFVEDESGSERDPEAKHEEKSEHETRKELEDEEGGEVEESEEAEEHEEPEEESEEEERIRRGRGRRKRGRKG